MDFIHNPYRCGPLRAGRYGITVPHKPGYNTRKTTPKKVKYNHNPTVIKYDSKFKPTLERVCRNDIFHIIIKYVHRVDLYTSTDH